mgnify:FL=1|tara:strand:- start:468 stop:1583 length:1116 start_codon:yes stop_codon:yes gene_type:complete
MTNNRYIGVMSGTSIDAIDIVLMEIFYDHSFAFLGGESFKFEKKLRKDILEISRNGFGISNADLKVIDQKLAHTYGESINDFISKLEINKNDIVAVGLHGQTILHQPNAINPMSLQIGDGQIVSDITGLTVIDDFRSADIKAGGQGAPLAPIFHSHFFRSTEENRAVINIGGISNISILKVNGNYSGYDIGPGNILLDSWFQKYKKGDYDSKGSWGKQGSVNDVLLKNFRQDSYFKKSFPKSTGTDYFNLRWIENNLQKTGKMIKPVDVQATLVELSALIITEAINNDHSIKGVALSGGGMKNDFLVSRIKSKYQGPIFTSNQWGLEPQWIEAAGFAYLAYLRMMEKRLDLSQITGSKNKVMLGIIHLPSQ